jgi:uncharacterized protein (UPF0276 family)
MNLYDNHHARPYGVGLAYRYPIHQDILGHRDQIDLLEISTEDYIVRERRIHGDPYEEKLQEALEVFPGVAHGLSLSIGTVAPLNSHYIEATKRFLEGNRLSVFSEHCAFHSVDGNDLTMFLPLPFEEASVRWIKQNYEAVRRELQRPFALENVTYHFPIPRGSLTEAQFLRRLTEETDCTLLLDVTNVFNNASNHGYDPIEFFETIPMERVSQMHLAGGHQLDDGTWEDSHSRPVMEPVWPLFEEAVKRARNCEIVILERDSKLNPFENVLADIDRAREIFYGIRPERPGPRPELDFEETGGITEPEAPQFAELKGFQSVLMARITSPQYREWFDSDPGKAAAEFGLTDRDWIARLEESDPHGMEKLAYSWSNIQKDDRMVEEEYEKSEWEAWADQIASENASTVSS